MTDKNNKPKIFYDQPPSKEFLSALVSTGSCVETCDFCDRTFFFPEGHYDWDEGELERLKKNAKRNPDKYIEVGGWISSGHIDGKCFVEGCPCNAVVRYESWLWSTRYLIQSFPDGKPRALCLDCWEKRQQYYRRHGKAMPDAV